MRPRGAGWASFAVIVSIILQAFPSGAHGQEPVPSLWIRLGTVEGDRIAKIEGNKLWLSKTAQNIDQQPPLLAKREQTMLEAKGQGGLLMWDSWVFSSAVPPQSNEASAGVSAAEIEIRKYYRSANWPEIITCYHRWMIAGTRGNTWVYEKEESQKLKPDLAFPYHAPFRLNLISCHFRNDSSPEFFVVLIQVGIKDSDTGEPVKLFQSLQTTNRNGKNEIRKLECAAQFRFLKADGTQVNVEKGVYKNGKVTDFQQEAVDRNQPGGPYSRECVVFNLPPGTYTATITYDTGPLAGVLEAEDKVAVPNRPFGPAPRLKLCPLWEAFTGYKAD